MMERSDALVNATLMVLGAAAVIDNVVVHWVLGWHRLIEGVGDPTMIFVELGLVGVGFVMFSVGAWRERAARSR